MVSFSARLRNPAKSGETAENPAAGQSSPFSTVLANRRDPWLCEDFREQDGTMKGCSGRHGRSFVCIYTLSVPRCAGSTPHGEGTNPGYMYMIRRCLGDQITVLSCQTAREGRQTGSNRAVRPKPSKMASFSARLQIHRNR